MIETSRNQSGRETSPGKGSQARRAYISAWLALEALWKVSDETRTESSLGPAWSVSRVGEGVSGHCAKDEVFI